MLKNIFSSLAAFLLIQHVADAQIFTNKYDTPRDKLFMTTTKNLSNTLKQMIEGGHQIFKDVIAEGSRTRNRKLQTHISELAEFVEEVDELENSLKLMYIRYILETIGYLGYLTENAFELINTYDPEDFDNASQDIREMSRLLTKYGSDEFIVKCFDSMNKFVKSLKIEVDAYLSSLDESEKQDEVEMLGWSKVYLLIDDMEEDVDQIFDFLELYNEESYPSEFSFETYYESLNFN